MIGLSPTRPGVLPVIPPVEGRSGEIAVTVAGNGTDGALLGYVTSALLERLQQFPQALFGRKIARLGKGHALLPAESERAFADQQYMGRTFHHDARHQYRVARSENAGHGTRPVVPPVHHRGVHLLRSRGGEDATPTGIEQGIVLEGRHGPSHRVERAPAHNEDIAARHQCTAQPRVIEGCAI